MRTILRAALITVVTLLSAVPSLPAQQVELGSEYLRRLTGIWEEHSTESDVEWLVELMSPDASYEHPRVGVNLSGKGTILAAMSAFLGTSRSPHISSVEVIAGRGIVVLSFELRMEVQGSAGWEAAERHQVVVLEVSDGLISRVIDYW